MSLSSQPELNNEDLGEVQHSGLPLNPQPQQSLLEHLQAGVPNPLDLLLEVTPTGHQHILGGAAPISDLIQSNAPMEAIVPPRSLMMEQGARLSQCKLWDMLRDYYANQGINAWANSVPSFITSSVYMAESYAECIIGFLTDYLDRIDLREPVYIVEMATGTGRFSFHLLRELERKLACFSRFERLKLRYVMTDFTESNPEFWQSNGRLLPYMQNGMLDFAVFNPLEEQSFTLRLSGKRVDSRQVKNPVIAIANYFFDSMPLDVFYMQDKKIKEGLVSLELAPDEQNPAAEPHISRIETHFEFRELPDHHYYPDKDLNAVLDRYRNNIPDGQILMPVGAFDIVRNLRKLSNDRLVLLSSDKGYTNPNLMTHVNKHEFAVHDGTFSYMVNYDALGQYFHNLGGKYFATSVENVSVQTVCLISGLPGGNKREFENLRYVFREKIDRQNPANSLCAMLPGREHTENPTLRLNYHLAQMRMHMSDPFIFGELAQHLLDLASQITWNTQRIEMLRLLDQAMENYYFCPGECNLPFLLAPIYFVLCCPEQSLFCLQVSEMLFGETPLQHFMMGQCFEQMGQMNTALQHVERAVTLEPEFPEAQQLLSDLRARLYPEATA